MGGNQAERKGESIGMGDKLIFYIPSDGDTVFDYRFKLLQFLLLW